MGRFTFAQGNATTLASLPLYGLGALACLVVPRRRGCWVFGSGTGVGEGALALFLHARAADPRLKLTWLARDSAEVAAAARHGIRAVRKRSLRGLWATLRAQVVVVTHGFGDVNRFGVRDAFVVQLWHGIPLKLIHLDSPATLRTGLWFGSTVLRRLLRRTYAHASASFSLLPAA
jgi:CDP-glycerol glycerophosphotransferase